MDRRAFVATGIGGIVGARGWWGGQAAAVPLEQGTVRAQFPRAQQEAFLNAAGGVPLGAFAEAGIRRYLDYLRHGPADGRRDYHEEVWGGVRLRFANLVGANESEIGLVECTKAGEQIVIDGLDALRRGGNVVTNDLHFSGCLHNYEGLRRSGMDVRIVKADPSFVVTLDRMAKAVDERTAMVAVSLVSNVNGHIEPVAELSRLAHQHGALLYADIIQAAGAIPLDLHAMGVDVAACSSYKWLMGVHGAGFLYVRDGVQGGVLPDTLFPGHVDRNYPPWVDARVSDVGDFRYTAPASAVRYQPGHVSYIGYAAVYEAMGFLERIGGAAAVQAHATRLVARLLDQLDVAVFRVITPEPARSPILSLQLRSVDGLVERLRAAGVVIGVGADMPRVIRISPSIYNTEADVDRLAEVLNA